MKPKKTWTWVISLFGAYILPFAVATFCLASHNVDHRSMSDYARVAPFAPYAVPMVSLWIPPLIPLAVIDVPFIVGVCFVGKAWGRVLALSALGMHWLCGMSAVVAFLANIGIGQP